MRSLMILTRHYPQKLLYQKLLIHCTPPPLIEVHVNGIEEGYSGPYAPYYGSTSVTVPSLSTEPRVLFASCLAAE